MLKVTTTDQNQTVTLKLEGKLAGPWVQEVTRVWSDTAQTPRGGYVIDLRSVTLSTALERLCWRQCHGMEPN